MKLRDFYLIYANPVLGLSAEDAYELERVLRNVKGFERGRPGPGGGADATPFSVAFVLIAIMAGGPRRRAVATATDYYEMTCEGAELAGRGKEFRPKIPVCPLTDERKFGPALKRILSTPNLAARVNEIVVSRDWPEAIVVYRDGRKKKRSRFVDNARTAGAARASQLGSLRVFCTLGGAPLHQMAIDLTENAKEDAEWTGK